MNETLDYLKTFALFPFGLRRFLAQNLTLNEAEKIIRDRVEHREENFLKVVERCIYGHRSSPYLALLKMARCEFGDLQRLVKNKGLEGALHELRGEGIYVTFEEFKGRKPIVRNGRTIAVTASDFDNPLARRAFATRTSGSTGVATYVGATFDAMAAIGAQSMITGAALGTANFPMAIWSPILPGPGFATVLICSYAGWHTTRWYSPIGWRDSKYWFKYGLATLCMILSARANGLKIPVPQIAKLDQASDIAEWMADTLKQHSTCILSTSVSLALRVAVAAEQAGLDLTGAIFGVGGEPLTRTKAESIQRVGARVLPSYGMVEAGYIGASCGNPMSVDEVHLLRDSLALITYPYTVEGLGVTVPSFNLTSLLDNAPKILFNVQADDYGIVDERQCGCPLETYGYSTHIREIRSYSKLVGEGVTLIGNEMVRILENVLPQRFGGSALDYQLMEQKDAQGFTRLYLLISPRVQISDEHTIIQVMLEALSKSSPMADAARLFWEQAQTIQIKRQEPVWTSGSKLHPLHIHQRHTN